MTGGVVRRSLWLAVLSAIPAVAQTHQLAIQGAPLSQNLGVAGAPFVVQRQNLNGSPASGGPVSVSVSARDAGLSPTGDINGPWTDQLVLTIPGGSSVSPSIWVRTGTPGPLTVTASGVDFFDGRGAITITRTIVADTFESGGVFTTDVPAGQWNSGYSPSLLNTIEASRAAAHRDQWGLRVTDIDPGDGGPDGQNSAVTRTHPVMGDLYFRTWFRMTNSNGVGNFVLGQLAATTSKPNLVELAVRANTGQLVIEGFNDGAQPFQVDLDAGIARNRWHLVEFAALGAGTDAGRRVAWLDAREIFSQSGASWVTYPLLTITLGEPWSAQQQFQGVLDFDDPRVTIDPPASRLTLVPGSVQVRSAECVPFTVSLSSSSGVLGVPAPYDVTGTLLTTNLQTFSERTCSTATSQFLIAGGQTSAQFFVRGIEPGAASAEAASVDFLPAKATLDVLDSGIVPVPDGGLIPPDGGSTAPGTLTVGCGCGSSELTPWVLVGCVLLTLRRRQ